MRVLQHFGGQSGKRRPKWTAAVPSGSESAHATGEDCLGPCIRAVGAGSVAGVDLSSFRSMDPHLLVGLVNTELRNHCDSLEDLVKTHGLDEGELVRKLAEGTYEYRPGQNQFR